MEEVVLKRSKWGADNHGFDFSILGAGADDGTSPAAITNHSSSLFFCGGTVEHGVQQEHATTPPHPPTGPDHIAGVPPSMPPLRDRALSELMYHEITEAQIANDSWRHGRMQTWLKVSGAAALRDREGQTTFAEYADVGGCKEV